MFPYDLFARFHIIPSENSCNETLRFSTEQKEGVEEDHSGGKRKSQGELESKWEIAAPCFEVYRLKLDKEDDSHRETTTDANLGTVRESVMIVDREVSFGMPLV